MGERTEHRGVADPALRVLSQYPEREQAFLDAAYALLRTEVEAGRLPPKVLEAGFFDSIELTVEESILVAKMFRKAVEAINLTAITLTTEEPDDEPEGPTPQGEPRSG